MTRDRMTVQEAARRLGVTDDAIRKRIQRGTLEHDKDPDGRVYVYLGATEGGSHVGEQGNATRAASWDTTRDVTYDALLESLRDQVHYLRCVLEEERDAGRRADMIIAQLTQANAALAARVPELEAPPAESAPPQRASEGSRGAAESGPRPRSVTQGTPAGRGEPRYGRWFGG
jgi:excisionase family DNA binding protein